MMSEKCGLSTLLKLPDAMFAIISKSLLPSDICNLSLCCRSLFDTTDSDEVWIPQCEMQEIVSPQDIAEWRKGVTSYKALCRFLVMVRPLMGIWVHQNPELGNVVYVVPGFVSVVGCRIIPQVVGPLGIENSSILWAPVFEIIGDSDGSAEFFLHGRENGHAYLYPGSVKSVERSCNVLLLEVEPSEQKSDTLQRISRDEDGVLGSQTVVNPMAAFNRLSFDDRTTLLTSVTSQIRQKVSDSTTGPLFPCWKDGEGRLLSDREHLSERRSILLKISKSAGDQMDGIARFKFPSDSISTHLELSDEDNPVKLHEFLGSNDRIELSLRASSMELDTYKTWPSMNGSLHALYKMPLGPPRYGDDDYAGLWGGTFGWPPWKPGEALFLLLLSYEKFRGQRHLIATKILEGTNYVHRPNGSAMFVVNIDDPSNEVFPWDTYPDSCPVNVEHAFTGEGITDGYGFRYPGSMPGSLFVTENGLLAFVWKSSQTVLTLQRINLPDLLRNGEQVHALPPIPNFSSLSTCYINVFVFPDRL